MASLLISSVLLTLACARPQLESIDNLLPLQFSVSSGHTLIAVPSSLTTSTRTSSSISATITGDDSYYDTDDDPVLTGSVLSAYVSDIEAIYPSLTGTALSAYISEVTAAAYPTLTGAALSSYISEEDAAYPTLTGAALSSYISEVEGAYPTLTGAALSSYISEENAAYPTLTGAALSSELAAVSSEIAELDAEATGVPSAGNTTDACGPKIPDPTVPDSCDTPVEQVDTPAAYGVQCLNDTSTNTAVNLTSCAILIPELCSNQWQNPGSWVWLASNGCAVGSYLPPATVQGAAKWPAEDQCEDLIYASMVDDCIYSGDSWNIAAVNLKELPSSATIGQAVNAGYGSYLVAEHNLRE